MQENNRIHALRRRTLSIPSVQERATASIRFRQTQVKQIDAELLDLLENSEWAENARRLLSIKCVGVVTAGWLLVATVNFTNLMNWPCSRTSSRTVSSAVFPNHRL